MRGCCRFVFELNEWVAEETGVHLGDGEMGVYPNNFGLSYQFGYTGNLREDELYLRDHVALVVYRAYGKMPSTVERFIEGGYIRLRYYSKSNVPFKNSFLKLPLGRKHDLRIPRQIAKDPKLLRLCVRGLFDTDGSVYFDKNRDRAYSIPVISISNTSHGLLKEVSEAAHKLGLGQVAVRATRPGHGRYKRRKTLYEIHYKGDQNLESWMRTFGTRNLAKLSRILMYEKFGECGPGISFRTRLKMLT